MKLFLEKNFIEIALVLADEAIQMENVYLFNVDLFHLFSHVQYDDRQLLLRVLRDFAGEEGVN